MDKRILFEELNKELEKQDITLEIICVGGFVLEYYNLRGTQDIDAFYQEDFKIRSVIKGIGDRFGINGIDELWLNNSVSNLNKAPSRSICKIIFSFSHLTVLVPPLIFILGMKLQSGRERDRQDVGMIIQRLQVRSHKRLISDLEEYGFESDLSIVLESFEYAYGMDWLSEYISEYLEEL